MYGFDLESDDLKNVGKRFDSDRVKVDSQRTHSVFNIFVGSRPTHGEILCAVRGEVLYINRHIRGRSSKNSDVAKRVSESLSKLN